MPAFPASSPTPSGLDLLRVELPDLAYDLERQGRLDAADVVMMLHARVRELAPGTDQTRQTTDHPQTVSILPPS